MFVLAVQGGMDGDPRIGYVPNLSGLVVSCEACFRRRYIPPKRAFHLWGTRSRLSTIAADCVCERCGKGRVKVSIVTDEGYAKRLYKLHG